MRLILMGTGSFAVPTFHALLTSHHDVVALVTRPVPPARGRHKGPVNPVLEAFASSGIPVLDPVDVNDAATCHQLRQWSPGTVRRLRLRPDPVARHAEHRAARRYQPARFAAAEVPRRRTHQLGHLAGRNRDGRDRDPHDSPPGWRSLLDDRPHRDRTGRGRCPPSNDDWPTGGSSRCCRPSICSMPGTAGLGSAHLRIRTGHACPAPAEIARRVDWTRPATRIVNQVGALRPWPGTYTHWLRQTPHATDPRTRGRRRSDARLPSRGVTCTSTVMHVVATGHQCLAIHQVQPAGKRIMDTSEFLRGHPRARRRTAGRRRAVKVS